MHLPFLPVIREALGFASHQYDTIARLAWFPLLLIVLLGMMFPYLVLSLATGELVTVADLSLQQAGQRTARGVALLTQNQPVVAVGLYAGFYAVIIILYASFMVPLMQLAARGASRTHRSLHLEFGPRELKFVFFSFLTVLGVGLVTLAPLTATTYYVNQYVTEAMSSYQAVFPNSESLHTVQVEPMLSDREPFDAFLKSFGAIISLVILYLSIRMFAAPIFAAVREKTDNYNSAGASWQLTSGWNTFWVALIVLLLAGSTWVVGMVINAYALPLILTVLNGIWGLLREISGLEPGNGISSAEILAILNWVWGVVRIIANMLWQFFVAGIIAGLGGALFRQIPGRG